LRILRDAQHSPLFLCLKPNSAAHADKNNYKSHFSPESAKKR